MSLAAHDRKIIDVLKESKFTLSAEVIPPGNGAQQVQILEQIRQLIAAGSQFLSVTKGAGGSLRGGSLPIVHAIKNEGVPGIAHFTCRDLTPQEVENQLVDHHYFGVRNILALRGDPPSDQPDWQPRDGSYTYAYQLIEQIRALNQGKYLSRPSGPSKNEKEATDFCIGAAVYPEHVNANERIEFFRRKTEAGAEYAITQMVFSAEVYAEFLELCAKNGIHAPILPGTRILTSRGQAQRMAKRFTVAVPESMLQDLPEDKDPDAAKKSLDVFYKFSRRLETLGAPGLHVFVLNDTQGSCELIRTLGKNS